MPVTLEQFIIDCEGLVLKPYDMEGDISGVDTIGVGHKLTQAEHKSGIVKIGKDSVRWTSGITKAQALTLLNQDLTVAISCVQKNVGVPLSENQLWALTSFVFNIGCGRFIGTPRNPCTLRNLLNAGAYDQVPDQLRRWVKNNGQVSRGLKNRREKEILMWEGKWKTSTNTKTK